ncbi:MAG: P-type conjugative transfer protein TrbJ [Desulfovibrio sp.]
MRLFISFLFLFTCFGITQNAEAQYVVTCTNCSDTFTQSLDHVTNIEQLSQLYTQVEQSLQQTAKQIELVQQGIEQYENMLQNTAKLPSSFASKLQGMLSKLSTLTQQLDLQRGDASALSQIFKATYKSVDDIHDVMSSAKDSMTEVNSLRKKWSEEVDRSHQAAFQESGMQISYIEQKASDLDSQLNDLLTTPDGQMKALEAGNQIAAMQLQESQRLRSLLAISTQANVQKAMKDEKNEQLSEEAYKDAFETDKLKNCTSVDDPF